MLLGHLSVISEFLPRVDMGLPISGGYPVETTLEWLLLGLRSCCLRQHPARPSFSPLQPLPSRPGRSNDGEQPVSMSGVTLPHPLPTQPLPFLQTSPFPLPRNVWKSASESLIQSQLVASVLPHLMGHHSPHPFRVLRSVEFQGH